MWNDICHSFFHIFNFDAIGILLNVTKDKKEVQERRAREIMHKMQDRKQVFNPLAADKYRKATPGELLSPNQKTRRLFVLEGKCHVQSILVAAIHDIMKEAYGFLGTGHLVVLLDCLQLSYENAKNANSSKNLMSALEKKSLCLFESDLC